MPLDPELELAVCRILLDSARPEDAIPDALEALAAGLEGGGASWWESDGHEWTPRSWAGTKRSPDATLRARAASTAEIQWGETGVAVPFAVGGSAAAMMMLSWDAPPPEAWRATVTVLAPRVARALGRRHATAKAESQTRMLLAGVHGILFEFDRGGRYLEVLTDDPALLARPPEELLGRTIDEILGKFGPPFTARVQRVIDGGTPESFEYPLVVNGKELWFAADVFRIASGTRGEPTAAFVAWDITSRKRAELALAVSDRLASVGTLAAGVAHEVNNPLTYVMTNIAWVRSELERKAADTELLKVLVEAFDGAERVRRIVLDLKTFARAADDRGHVPIDVRESIRAAVNLTSSEVRHRAMLEQDLGPTPVVIGDSGRLSQVLVNFLMNSVHAIGEGAPAANRIRIATSTDASGSAVISVSDTGCGIPKESLGRIFDPFFTTKPVGIGTGLGLSICHGIVTSFGGRIEVESAPGAGATFRVILPGAPEATVAAPAPPAQPARRRASLLVVDDEPQLLRSLERVLARDHDVHLVPSVDDAMSWLAGAPAVDVVICDVMMPGSDGEALYERVRRARPDLAPRIVFMTGGAFTPRAKSFLDAIPNARLDKPIDIGRLRALIAERAG